MLRILYVDDEPEWRRWMTRALDGYEVDATGDYVEALRFIRRYAYDLALVDWELRRDDLSVGGPASGGEILDVLRADRPSTRRILVTGRPPPGSMHSGLFVRYGLEEILIKGLEMELPGL